MDWRSAMRSQKTEPRNVFVNRLEEVSMSLARSSVYRYHSSKKLFRWAQCTLNCERDQSNIRWNIHERIRFKNKLSDRQPKLGQTQFSRAYYSLIRSTHSTRIPRRKILGLFTKNHERFKQSLNLCFCVDCLQLENTIKEETFRPTAEPSTEHLTTRNPLKVAHQLKCGSWLTRIQNSFRQIEWDWRRKNPRSLLEYEILIRSGKRTFGLITRK